MARLKIALCITDLDVGGAERALVQLATRLDRRRFEPTVYCLGPRPPINEASCVPPLEKAGIEVHCLGAAASWQIVPVARQLKRLFEARLPDMVQSFLFHANLVSRIAAWRAGVRPVISGIRVAEPRRWHLWADRWTGSLVDRYVCVSESVARFSFARAGLPAEKMVVIPNGVDPDRYPAERPADPASLGVAEGRRMVIFVGRLDPQKGVGWLVDSAPAWLEQAADYDLVLVGQGPEQALLERRVAELGIAGRVHFPGWRGDVPEILAASELLVLPSRWEGMPNVVLEAMASRLPVVASDVEGVRELLGPNAEQQTVRYGDSHRLAERIVQLVSDRKVARELGSRNRRRVEEEFTFDKVVDAYQDLWQSLARA
jgi:starch synthase (maltosyl-transferring)